MSGYIWDLDDVRHMMEDDVQERERRDRLRRRHNLKWLALVCAVVLATVGLITCGPGDAGASESPDEHDQFAAWYANENNRDWYHFNEWYSASERNAVWYHIREHFGMGRLGDQAVRIARCESRHNPRARSRTNDHGLFQINAVHRRNFEQVTGQPWQPGVYHASHNSRFAKDLYDRQGWRPWVCNSY